MPFDRPTLPALIDRAESDIETRLPGTDARLRASNLNVLARVHAGAIHGLYGYLDWIALQVLPDTADEDQMSRWASIFGVDRKDADYAVGNVQFTGTDGSTITAGTQMQRSDGELFTVDADATISGGTVTVAVTAVTAGSNANTSANSALTLLQTIPGVNVSGTVTAAGLVGGTEVEDIDAWRARLLTRIRQQPHGGADFDYVTWALEVSGVTRAWVYPKELGVGTVVVRFVRDNDASIIPDAAEVQAVQDYIDALKPVIGTLTVAAPIATPLDLTISGLSPNDQTTKDAVEAELTDLLAREAVPGGTILLSHIREAISIAAGENDHTLDSPTANVTHSTGELAVLGTITWV